MLLWHSSIYWSCLPVAVSMVNGMTVNGLGEVTALTDAAVAGTNNTNSSLLGLGKQLSNYLILGTPFLTWLLAGIDVSSIAKLHKMVLGLGY